MTPPPPPPPPDLPIASTLRLIAPQIVHGPYQQQQLGHAAALHALHAPAMQTMLADIRGAAEDQVQKQTE